MSTIETLVLWACFAMLAWLSLSIYVVYEGIRKILFTQIEMKSRIESIQSIVWNSNDSVQRNLDEIKSRLGL